MKYIVTRRLLDGEEEIFTFPNSVHHDCMAELICHIRDQSFGSWKRTVRKPISAGFVKGEKCVGNSESLNLCSREKDTTILEKQN